MHHVLWACPLYDDIRAEMLDGLEVLQVGPVYYADLVGSQANFRRDKGTKILIQLVRSMKSRGIRFIGVSRRFCDSAHMTKMSEGPWEVCCGLVRRSCKSCGPCVTVFPPSGRKERRAGGAVLCSFRSLNGIRDSGRRGTIEHLAQPAKQLSDRTKKDKVSTTRIGRDWDLLESTRTSSQVHRIDIYSNRLGTQPNLDEAVNSKKKNLLESTLDTVVGESYDSHAFIKDTMSDTDAESVSDPFRARTSIIRTPPGRTEVKPAEGAQKRVRESPGEITASKKRTVKAKRGAKPSAALLRAAQEDKQDGTPYGSAVSSDSDAEENMEKEGLTASTKAQLMDCAHKAVSAIAQIATGDTSKLNKTTLEISTCGGRRY
ncbi:hypothetical protein EVAR_103864_1 [Eumeta japonica]|uniref:Uncharacterized protein n=1 Tax=Eumeta variegata TaxID=151549 RepID=A0A4C2A911_EUMVA|nr:hypothetical protein EVAR_103864_1 [Eumeta japonica]